MLPIKKKTVILIVTGNAFGFLTGSGNVILFSVDLIVFCRSIRLESNTTIKLYISHDVLLSNAVHNVTKGSSFFELLTTNWYKIIFWMPNRMNCNLCMIIRRDLGFFVVAHRLPQRGSFSISTKLSWILIVSKYWWENSPVVAYVGSWKRRVAVVANCF